MILATALSLVPAAAVARPGELRVLGDWVVGCDNLRECQAAALLPPGADRVTYLMLLLRRSADATMPAQLEVRFPPSVARGTLLTLAIDGTAVARLQAPGDGGGMALPYAGALGAALGAGRWATLADPRGRRIARVSLAGLAAAVRHIDAVQQRPAVRPASRRARRSWSGTIPPPPAMPVILQPPVGIAPPRAIRAKEANRMIGIDAVLCDRPRRRATPRSFRLDADHTLVTIDHPCGTDTVDRYTSLFLLGPKGTPVPAAIDAPPGVGAALQPVVADGGWDPATRRLTSVLGNDSDCGTRQWFAWDGTAFRLVEQRAMAACRGATSYIVTWRARVVTQ